VIASNQQNKPLFALRVIASNQRYVVGLHASKAVYFSLNIHPA
jgi:hypothetical protein